MTVTYHSGRRIQGTQADFDGIPAASGGWKEVGRTTLGSAGDTITVSSLPDKRYYMLLTDNRPSGNLNVAHRAGNGSIDTGSNYAKRPSINGASDITHHVNNNNFLEIDGLNHTDNMFSVNYLSNKSDKEKLGIGHSVRQNTSGAGNAPNRTEYVGKWANTSNVIDILQTINFGSGDLASGSELVVLGYDPDDTHTDNFWEELANVTLSGASSSLDSGTITAKKYIWYQVFIKKNSASNNYAEHSINGITTGNTWARRINSNGGTDGTNTSQNTMNTTDTGAGGYFLNGFVINNSGQEKLFIEHVIQNTSSGAGNAPDRKEIVMKSTTSAQITQLTVTGATNGYDSGSFIKVWGSN